MVIFLERTAAERLWNFEDLPLSRYTLEGLKSAKYTRLTAIQRAALPHSLTGKDVLGAAKTGSGKTLAFVIPVRLRVSANAYCLIIDTFYNSVSDMPMEGDNMALGGATKT